MIRRVCTWTLGCAALVLLSGCSLAGTWKTVEVKPDTGRGIPFSMITFDESNMLYTASETRDGRTVTSTGVYRWNNRTLTLTPEGHPPRKYKGFLWWGKTLKLTCRVNDQKIKATLAKQPLP